MSEDVPSTPPYQREARLIESAPSVLPYYDLKEIDKFIGKNVRISGVCCGVGARYGSIKVRLVGGEHVFVSIYDTWPSDIADAFNSTTNGTLCVEVEGTLTADKDKKMRFSERQSIRFWIDSIVQTGKK